MEKESELSRSLSPIAFVYWHSAKLILSFPVGKRSAVVAVSDVVVNTAKKIYFFMASFISFRYFILSAVTPNQKIAFFVLYVVDSTAWMYFQLSQCPSAYVTFKLPL